MSINYHYQKSIQIIPREREHSNYTEREKERERDYNKDKMSNNLL